MGSRTTAGVLGVIAFGLLCFSGVALYGSTGRSGGENFLRPERQAEAQKVFPAAPAPSLIIEPQDGMAPVAQLIEGASSSIDVVMYEFEDTQLEQLLAEKAKEGIAVRIILDNGYFGAGSAANEQAFDYLQTNGAQVHWSPEYFALTHEKSLVVDGKTALIMTFNFSPQYYKSDRDFGIVDNDPDDVSAIEQTFDSDWNGRNLTAQNGDDLVWSPNSRAQLLAIINGAQTSLDIYNEEMQDPQIISALSQAAQRGVDVEVDMSYAANWKPAFQTLSNAGVHVRTYAVTAPLYIHAKVIIADDREAFVGSENFSSTSLDQNRELGIVVSDPAVVSSLAKTFAGDWRNATTFTQ